MGEYYLFAGFMFVLLLILIFFNDKLRRSRGKQEDKIKDKEKRLFKLYQSLEDMMESIEDYIEKSKGEIRDSLGESKELFLKAEKAKVTQLAPPVREIPKKVENIAMPTQKANPNLAEASFFPEEEIIEIKSLKTQRSQINENGSGQEKQAKRIRGINKIEEVRRLNASGLTSSQIAQELSLSKGEVELILKLK